MRSLAFIFSLLMIAMPVCAQSVNQVILLNESFPKSSASFYSSLKNAISTAKFDVKEVDGIHLSQALSETASPGSILVLPSANYFPSEAKASLLDFLKRGNHLMAVSGPALENLAIKAGDKWLTQDQTKDAIAQSDGKVIIDFSKEDLSKWSHSTGSPKNLTTYAVIESGDTRVPAALNMKIGKLENWDTLVSTPLEHPFPEGFTATTFWAKGGPNTPELLIEWTEKDGARWMATVRLTPEWKRYALLPEDFRFWAPGSTAGRGGAKDSFNPANAGKISFGLADGLSSQKMGIAHELWVSDIRTAKNEFENIDFGPPILESISPSYKLYQTDAYQVEQTGTSNKQSAETSIFAPLPRTMGVGSDAVSKYRMIPVLRAYDKNGELRGTAAHLLLNTQMDYQGSIWGFIGFSQEYLENNTDRYVPVIISMMKRMQQGTFLSNAGTDQFAYTDGEKINYGAYIENLYKPANITVSYTLFSANKILKAQSFNFQMIAQSSGSKAVESSIGQLPPGQYKIKTILSVGSKPVDEITQDFSVIKYGKLTSSNTVTARDGDFWLDGKKWYATGINYWPRYATGLEYGNWVHWLAPEQYNPEIIEQDLTLAQKLGINLVSIQYNTIEQARPFMDFMDRCSRHGIKVNAYMPGLHPLFQDFNTANAMIKAAHIADDSAFFAYDVGWEVHVGYYDQRALYDKQWQDWVIDRYGSIENAQSDWQFTPAVREGLITGPSDEQLMNDGDWRIYVAAYRRFWDDEISKRYKAVRSNIKCIDRSHLIGARSGYGGTGSTWAAPSFPFDMASGAKHLDFTSPEAYGLSGDWLGFLKGGLNTIYGRFVSGGKPVYWAEYGISIWPRCDKSAMEEQRRYYENIERMAYVSGANGTAGWWWPGGFRVGENSDYGTVNPDGTPRPSALEIKKRAQEFSTQRNIAKPDIYFTIDRDMYVQGYAGIYNNISSEYAGAIQKGKVPGLKTAGTGTDSANTPRIAVGNVPYNGNNPLKYLNAEFNYIKINGRFVKDDALIEVEQGKPVVIDASIGNVAESKWLAMPVQGDGQVSLLIREVGTDKSISIPIPRDTPFLSDIELHHIKLPDSISGTHNYIFTMAVDSKDRFGEVFKITLKAK